MKRIILLTLVVGAFAVGACGGEGRPTAAEWQPRWEAARALVPDAAGLEAGGAELCGSFLGEVRTQREDLLPTPGEPTDDAFTAWVEQAESLGLDCTDDTEDLDARLDEIQGLADQVDLALSGE